MAKKQKTKPQFGTWTDAKYPPPIGILVIVCRAGQGCSFEAKRVRRKLVWPKDWPGVFWTNATVQNRPIEGITHWMPMPPAKTI